MWDLSGKQLAVLGHEKYLLDASFSLDGKQILSTSANGTARVWYLSENLLRQLKLPAPVSSNQLPAESKIPFTSSRASFSSDEQYILSISTDGIVRVWDISGKLLLEIKDSLGASFSPDGQQIVTASLDGIARIWDLSGKLLVELKGHQGIVESANFSPDGKFIVTASYDKTAVVWEILDSQTRQVAFLQGHQESVSDANFSPDGKLIVTASNDGTAIIWDLSGKLISRLKESEEFVQAKFSPDSKLVVTTSYDNIARVWNISGKLLAELKGHQDDVNEVSFSPDGKFIVTASEDKSARIWDVSGKLLTELKGHQARVRSASFSPNSKFIVTISDDQTVAVWDTSGKLLAQMQGIPLFLINANFSPDSKLIVAASNNSGTVRVWDFLEKTQADFQANQRTARQSNFSPDGKLIVTVDGNVRLWDLSGKLLVEIKVNGEQLGSADFSPDGQRIITTSSSGIARVWDTSGKLLTELKGHEREILDANFSLDGKLIVTASWDQTARVWDTSGKQLAVLKGHDMVVLRASFSPDSKHILTIASDHPRLWDTSGKLLADFQGVENASFSPDGKYIISVSYGGTVRVWDFSGQQLVGFAINHDDIGSLSFSPDGKQFVTASFDGIVRVWDWSGKLLAELKGHQGSIESAIFSRDGKLIVTASKDKTSRVWDTSGNLVAEIKGHQGEVKNANFSPDSKLIITSSDDGTVRVWNTAGKQLAILNSSAPPSSPKVEADRLRDLQFYAPNCAKAFEPWEKALKLYQEISDNENQAVILEQLGNAHYCLSDYTKAIEFYNDALEIAKKSNYLQRQVKNLANLSNVYNSLADYEVATKYYSDALKILDQNQDAQFKAEVLQSRSNIYISQGKYNEAIQDLSQALAIDKNSSSVAKAKVSLANIYYSLSDYNKAIQYYKEAAEFIPSESLGGLGNVYLALGDTIKAIDFHSSSLAKAQQNEDKEAEGNALNNLANSLHQAGKLPEAEKYLRDAIAIWENLRITLNDANKISIFEKQTRSYRLLQKVLIAQNKITEALEVSESGRARAFIDLLSKRLSPNQTEQLKVPALNTEQIKQVAKNENATIVQYSIITDEFKVDGKLATQDSELYIWVIKPTGEIKFYPVDLNPLWQKQNTSLTDKVAQSRQSIVKGVNVASRGSNITFTPGDRVKLNDDDPDWEAWQIISVDVKNGKITIRLPSWEAKKPAIERPIADVAKKIGINSSGANAKNLQLQELYQLLIQPIADILPKEETDRVIFMPQDALFLVPFPALQDSSGQYLIDKYTILTAPSIQVLESTHKLRQKVPGSAKDILIVGNPTMPKVSKKPGELPQQLGALPGSEKEALAIASFWKTQALIGNQATKKVALQKLPLAKIIHLATHGLLDDIRGLGSSIVFAPEGQDNGLLTAEDILNLYTPSQGSALSAELVVLSACDTGQGRLTGDGVIGLSRSIIAAGVPSVIVSLWSIPDAPTAELMTKFYENFRKNPDKAAALRQAMLTTKKKHPNPADWAAFTLIGESK